jgi:hemolysin activation/secretion protein
MNKTRHSAICATIVTAISTPIWAQQAPDAGQVLQQQQQQAPQPPRESPPLNIQTAPLADLLPGGQQVTLQSVAFAGNTVFSAQALAAVLGDLAGKSHDLAGLRGLANRISEYYRVNGYPFARAFLPPQTLEGGQLRIEVVEGRYGQVRALSEDPQLAAQAQTLLSPLQPGAVIQSQSLERVTLLLDDLPGIRTAPVIRPGEQTGTGDLDVRIEKARPSEFDFGLDNHGNRYTGYYRVRFNGHINSRFLLGDQISFNFLRANNVMYLGSVGYSFPVGVPGWRAAFSYSRTHYDIGQELAASQADGDAGVLAGTISYAWLRSQKSNLTLSAGLQHKRLTDSNLAGKQTKSSLTVPFSLQFDHRDSLGGGGITFGSASWTPGRVRLDPLDTDRLQTRGNFHKLNLDVARLQALGKGLNLYARASTQHANQNLDSSEDMSLAGASGVRAYPVGEISGDEGWTTQIELRYTTQGYTPYVFYDHGSLRTNRTDVDGTSRKRTLAGAGVGLRYQRNGWNTDVAMAWRSQGGRAADLNERDAQPRVWVSVRYHF